MEIRKFRSEYKLELIPASHEGIVLGDLVWDPILGPPDFSRKGMPNTIYTAFLDAGLINDKDWKEFRKENQDTKLVDAHFATRHVEVNVEFISELQHPKIGKISSDFKTENLSKFTFRELQMREMDDLMRIKIDRFLEQMKAAHWSDYDGSNRRDYRITELYYATIRMLIETQSSTDLEASPKKANLRPTGPSE